MNSETANRRQTTLRAILARADMSTLWNKASGRVEQQSLIMLRQSRVRNGTSAFAGLVLFAMFLLAVRGRAQTNDAISREVSFFNLGQSSAPNGIEAISREVSFFNFSQSTAPNGIEAISREISLFNLGQSSAPNGVEAISREISFFNFGQSTAPNSVEAISREVSFYNYGSPPISFAVGSTNIVGDAVSQVPFNYQTVFDLTNLSLTLLSDDSHLQVLGVTPATAEVQSVSLGTPGVNSHPISFALNSAAIPPTNHTLAYLNFQGVTNLNSAVVQLVVSNLAGYRTSGQLAPGVPTNGQVIVIVSKPILFATNEMPFSFTSYGVPGATYSIQATTNLAPANWVELERLLETGEELPVTGLTNRGPQQFYRVEQVGP